LTLVSKITVTLHGSPSGFHGCTCLRMDVHGLLWISMDLQGHPRISKDFSCEVCKPHVAFWIPVYHGYGALMVARHSQALKRRCTTSLMARAMAHASAILHVALPKRLPRCRIFSSAVNSLLFQRPPATHSKRCFPWIASTGTIKEEEQTNGYP